MNMQALAFGLAALLATGASYAATAVPTHVATPAVATAAAKPATAPAMAAAAKPVAAPVAAATKPANASQQRMGQCSHAAAGKKGDAYKAAVSSCMRGSSTAAKPATPQTRMKTCNAEAGQKTLKGDARKAFMSSCLKAA